MQMAGMALWVDLLKEGQARAQIPLSEFEESYTVFMLCRFMDKPGFMDAVLALSYLESQNLPPHKKEKTLRTTADTGIILAGLFPERAERLNVSCAYFVEMSKACFTELASLYHRMRQPIESRDCFLLARSAEKLSFVLGAVRGDAIQYLRLD